MEERYIKVGNSEIGNIFVGNDEIGFGFVGDQQFFGQQFDGSVVPQFSDESIFIVQGSVYVDIIPEYEYKYEWYYNDENTIIDATKIDCDTNSLLLTPEYVDKYIICKVTYSKQFYYGSNSVYLFSVDKVQDNREKRAISILFSGESEIQIGKSKSETLRIVPSDDLTLENLVVVGDVPQGFITITYTNNRYQVVFDGSKAEMGIYRFQICSQETDKYKYGESDVYTFTVLGTTILNPQVTLIGDGRYNTTLTCVPSTDTSDVQYTYRWRANGNLIENNSQELIIDDKRLIGQTITCDVTFSKQGYQPQTIKSNEVWILKGLREIRFENHDETSILYVSGNATKYLEYDITEGNGQYSISTITTTNYDIHNDVQSRYIVVNAKDRQMTTFDTLQLFTFEDDEYEQSNILTIKIQTLQNIWDDVVVNLTDNTQVGNTLAITYDCNPDLSYLIEDVSWYILENNTDKYESWKLIQGQTSDTIYISDDYKGNYIGTRFTIRNLQTDETIELLQVSNIVYMVLTVQNKSIEGNTYYGQKLTSSFDIYDQNGELLG